MVRTFFLLSLFLALSFNTQAAPDSTLVVNDADVDALFNNATQVQLQDLFPTENIGFTSDGMDISMNAGKNRYSAAVLAYLLGGCGTHRIYLGSPMRVWAPYMATFLASGAFCAAKIYPVAYGLAGLVYLVSWIDGTHLLFVDEDEFLRRWVASEQLFIWAH